MAGRWVVKTEDVGVSLGDAVSTKLSGSLRALNEQLREMSRVPEPEPWHRVWYWLGHFAHWLVDETFGEFMRGWGR
jgi:hypothetical protein